MDKKLSQLMRLGDGLPQIKEDYVQYDLESDDPDYPVIGTCALGGVVVQLFGSTYQTLDVLHGPDLDVRLREHFDLFETIAAHPITGEQQDTFVIVASLNDEYDWNRNAIADWLESKGY